MRQLVFPKEYFKSEVRDGFTVNELMKRTWAAQLEVLNRIMGVCEKHGLIYYADCGTLLGTVRHKGYIPWDDDLDIAMKKEDYIRFLEVAKEELPEEYCILNSYTEAECAGVFTRITNGSAIDFSDRKLQQYHGCPFVVGIDIFPLYYVPTEREQAEALKTTLQMIGAVASLEKDSEKSESNQNLIKEGVEGLEQITGYRFTADKPLNNQLATLYDQVCRSFEEEKSSSLTVFTRWLRKGYYVEKELLAECIQMPFENLTLNIPKGYDVILKRLYGDYLVPQWRSSGHDYPYYKGQLERLGSYIEEQDCVWKVEQGERGELEVGRNLSAEWLEKISSRKIILYYTGPDALMRYSEFVADKLHHVFEAFKNDSDVTLWWFPCMLDNPKVSFVRQMSPQLVKDYHQMIEEYKREGFGILDLSGNRQRAVSIADAYYGDESELSRMFRQTGKCVVIQDYTRLEEDESRI